MKILCLHQGADLYGSDRSFILTLRIIKKVYPRSTLTAIIPREGPIKSELEEVADELLIQDIGTIKRSDIKKPFRTISRIGRKIKEAIKLGREFDMVYINTIVILSYIIAARFIKKPVIIHVREIPGKLDSVVFSLLLRFSKAHIFYNSQNTKKGFLFQNKSRETVILNAVDGFVKETEAAPTPIKILVIGRIKLSKGQLLLAEAIASLPLEYQQKIRVRFVGDMPADLRHGVADLENVICEHKLEQIMEILPFAKDPAPHFLWSNIVAIPSITPESFGRVAIEGMSVGKPILAAEHGGITEIIEDNANGWFFSPADKLSLRSRLIDIIDTSENIPEMGRYAEKTFNEKYTAQIYENFLRANLNTIVK